MLFEDYGFEDISTMSHHDFTKNDVLLRRASIADVQEKKEDSSVDERALLHRASMGNEQEKKEDPRVDERALWWQDKHSPPLKLEPRPIASQGIQITDRLPLNRCFGDDVARRHLEEWIELLRPSNEQTHALPTAESSFSNPFNPESFSASTAAPDEFEPVFLAAAASASPVTYDSWRGTSTSFATGSDTDTPQIHQHQDAKWNERYNQLKEFHRVNGHSVVPYHYKEFPPLAWWVKRQRHQMRLKHMGSHHTLTEEREQMLNDLGFVWDTREMSWEQRFQELAMYKMKHGHLNIAQEHDSKLLVWMRSQRRQFKLLSAGAKSSLTPARVRKLNSIGFDW